MYIYIDIHINIYIYTYVCFLIHVYIYVNVYIYIYVYIHVYMSVSRRVCLPGTGILCMFALSPAFLQAYAPFFIGHTEISTAFLCLLGLLDDDHGVQTHAYIKWRHIHVYIRCCSIMHSSDAVYTIHAYIRCCDIHASIRC